MGKGNCHDSDDGSLSSGTHSSGCPTIESFQDLKSRSPVKPLQTSMSDLPNPKVKESDILSDDDEDYRLANLTKDSANIKSSTQGIEVQFQNLNISELSNTESKNLESNAPDREGNFQLKEHPKLVRGHFCAIKRKVYTTKADTEITKAMKDHHQSLDNQSDNASIDLNAILEREFSIQSLTSVVNEDCFYETAGKCGKS